MKTKIVYKVLLAIIVAGVLQSCSHPKLDHQLAMEVDEVLNYLRVHRRLPASPDIDSLACVLEEQGWDELAGMSLYMSGAGKNLMGEDEAAMQALKKAEVLLIKGECSDPYYLGMTYYKMGRISENEALYEVAQHYYRQAQPYLEELGEALYLASLYRELARMSNDTAEQRFFFEKAMPYAEEMDTVTYLDVRYAMLSRLEPHSPERLEISRYLCDSAEQKRYAQDVVREALRKGDYLEAQHYLEILSTDSTSLLWSQAKQAYLHCLYLHQTGQEKQAYLEMQALYDSLLMQQEADGRVRSFAIAQRFDNAAEREKNLRLQLQQQRLYATIAIILAAMLIAVASVCVIAIRRRTKRQLEETLMQAEIGRLRSELALRQQSLRNMLMQRLQLSKSLQESTIRHQNEGPLPDWAKQFVEANIFQTEEQWDAFKKEFNEAYEGILDRLKAKHPALTAVDQQVIALILLDMDISDICVLLNQMKRTIWSRRLRIKEHLGLTENDQLDDWLRQQITTR